MNKYYLLNFSDNYADEFDVYGFKVLTKEEYEKGKIQSEEAFNLGKKKDRFGNDSFEISFGTNESVEYYSFKDYMKSFRITEITQEEYDVLAKLFDNYGNRINYGFSHFFPLEY